MRLAGAGGQLLSRASCWIDVQKGTINSIVIRKTNKDRSGTRQRLVFNVRARWLGHNCLVETRKIKAAAAIFCQLKLVPRSHTPSTLSTNHTLHTNTAHSIDCQQSSHFVYNGCAQHNNGVSLLQSLNRNGLARKQPITSVLRPSYWAFSQRVPQRFLCRSHCLSCLVQNNNRRLGEGSAVGSGL